MQMMFPQGQQCPRYYRQEGLCLYLALIGVVEGPESAFGEIACR
jgi:hypothetical protein